MTRWAPWTLVATTLLSLTTLQAQSPTTTQAPPASPDAASGVTFEDATPTAGVGRFMHVSGTPAKRYLIEAIGSGVALWDFDNDGRLDIYAVNGSTLDLVRSGKPAPPAALLRGNGDGTFVDVTTETGTANGRWGHGVCAGDVDNDGFEDLYVTNFGPNRLFRNAGGRAFEDIAVAAGVAVDTWSTGCAFGDFDADGWLDLYVAGYVHMDIAHLPPAPDDGPSTGAAATGVASGRSGDTGPAAAAAGGSAMPGAPTGTQSGGTMGMGASLQAGASFCTYRSERVMCGPAGLPGAADHLFRNNGDGTFTDVTEKAGVVDARRLYGLGVAWFDADDDGRLDLIVANDSGPNHVYRNVGGGRFEDVSYQSGAALDGNGRSQAHMGVAIADYDNDGRDDIHITNFADDFNVLYRNHDGLTFSDVSFTAGVAQVSVPFLGWGTDFIDYDNDGWRDLLVVNGHVYPAADRLPWNSSYAQRALLFRNLGGRKFAEVGAAAGPALTTPRSARGSAVGDIDNDGDIDVVIGTLDGPLVVARNAGGNTAGHWLGVRLVGDPAQKTPRDAIGSVVWVTAGGVRQKAAVASGRGQISQSDLRLHFGLGTSTAVTRLEVRWANGPVVAYEVPRVDAHVTIDQKTGRVQVR